MNNHIEQISRCLRFIIYNDFFAVVNEKELHIYLDTEKYSFDIDSTEFIGRYNDEFLIKDYAGNGYVIKLDKFIYHKLDEMNMQFYDKNWNNLFPVYHSTSIFEPVENGIYDVLTNSVKFISKECKSNQILKNIYTGFFNDILFSNSIDTGKELWQFPLSQLSTYTSDEGEEMPAELVSIIGVYNTVVWFLVTDRRLIGLDTETGALLHEIHLCEALGLPSQTVENYSFSLGDTHLDEEKGTIKGFAHRYYWEFDLNNLQAEIKVDFGQGNTWRIKKSKHYQGDKNLYFTGARSGETFDRAIGVFDTQTYQITWYDEPLDEGRHLFFTDIQANDKLVGALDSEQNLRIYERE